jgi:hypothetical protein
MQQWMRMAGGGMVKGEEEGEGDSIQWRKKGASIPTLPNTATYIP